jgi:hypothetical protein
MPKDTIWTRFCDDFGTSVQNGVEFGQQLRLAWPSPGQALLRSAPLICGCLPLIYAIIIAVVAGLDLAWAWIESVDAILAPWYALIPAIERIRDVAPVELYGKAGVVLSHIVGVCHLLSILAVPVSVAFVLSARAAVRGKVPGLRPFRGVAIYVVLGMGAALSIYVSIVVYWLGIFSSYGELMRALRDTSNFRAALTIGGFSSVNYIMFHAALLYALIIRPEIAARSKTRG